MKFDKMDLLNELKSETVANLKQSKEWVRLNLPELNYKTQADTWSALECLEHLNRYGAFYLPEIKKCITRAPIVKETVFRSGLLGNYFANVMKPKPKLNKMKTFKNMNPTGSQLSKDTLMEFIRQQEELLLLLESASDRSWTTNKTSITISRWIKLRLGDTFRVVIHHNTRHVLQASKQLLPSGQKLVTH